MRCPSLGCAASARATASSAAAFNPAQPRHFTNILTSKSTPANHGSLKRRPLGSRRPPSFLSRDSPSRPRSLTLFPRQNPPPPTSPCPDDLNTNNSIANRVQGLIFGHVTAAAAAMTTPTRPLSERIPPGAWDSHMHVLDVENYALSPAAMYRPISHSLEEALSFEAQVGIRNIVLVQPSIYGLDNTCLIDTLRALGPERGRGVVAFDPLAMTPDTLREWHDLGVRAVRLNVQSNELTADAQELADQLHQYADVVRPFGWAVQVYVPMHMITLLEPIVPSLNIRFCIDHIGYPSLRGHDSADPYDLPGFASLARLLKNGHTYVKLSAPYRMSLLPDHSDIEPIAKEVIRLGGNSHVVFATDWPHTRYEGLDIKPWMETVLDWCGDNQHLIQRLFTGNAEDLWDVPKSS
ncbi:hypothetical protein N0V84_000292 [Fusarium piperis]|uniref:Amidohydrolase-related domain-containing protein n=1 Tax=Fusarium piperis TaxID=1435070 RepID=A0A9W9BUU8_9HYPO|nr:hypothetical protein N0V84_000292 [Fusarium piperis]